MSLIEMLFSAYIVGGLLASGLAYAIMEGEDWRGWVAFGAFFASWFIVGAIIGKVLTEWEETNMQRSKGGLLEIFQSTEQGQDQGD